MRKYMRVIASLVVLLAFVCLMLGGCHGAQTLDEFSMPENFDTSRNYSITFWAKNDTNMSQVAVYNQAVADFEALYPNIDVTVKFYTDYGRIYNDVITNISTGTTPNVCITYPDHIATYMTGTNTMVSLDELMTDEKYGLGGSEVLFDSPEKTEIVSKFLEEGKINDKYYALPYMRSTEACYVNKTYVEKLGYTLPDVLTWDFVFEVSRAATAKAEDGTYAVNGQNVLIPFIYKSTDNMMIQMLKQLGADYSTEDGECLVFNDTTEGLLYSVAESVESGAFSTFKISGYPANFLNAGQCIFAVDSTAGATWMGSDAPLIDIPEESLVEFETEVRMVPQFDTENPKMISQGPSVCIFNKHDPQEVLASWLFAQYLLTDKVQISYATIEGYVPVTTQAQNNPEYQEYLSHSGENNDTYYSIKMDATNLLLNNVNNTFVTPVFNGSASLRDASGYLIESVTKAVRRGQNVDIEKLFNDTKSLYRLDQKVNDDSDVQRENLGELPAESIALLSVIGAFWLGIAFLGVYKLVKKSKNEKNAS